VLLRRAHVDEVDAEPVDRGAELREGVQAGLRPPPVVLVGPVAAQVAHVGERDPLGPVVDRLGLGPSRPPEALVEVSEDGVGHIDPKRRDVGAHAASPGRPPGPAVSPGRPPGPAGRRTACDWVTRATRLPSASVTSVSTTTTVRPACKGWDA